MLKQNQLLKLPYFMVQDCSCHMRYSSDLSQVKSEILFLKYVANFDITSIWIDFGQFDASVYNFQLSVIDRIPYENL